MKNTTTMLNTPKIKKFYLDSCRAKSIKPKKKGFNEFIAILENDMHYWMKGNLKYFFERNNY